MKTENTIWQIIQEMSERGGSFVQALAAAMKRADPENLERILAAFPEIIERYDALATFNNKYHEI